MSLHVTPNTKRLPTPSMRALERLLARVAMRVNPERAGATERFIARLADITILALRKGGLRRRGDVVVVLPGVGAGGGLEGYGDRYQGWWE